MDYNKNDGTNIFKFIHSPIPLIKDSIHGKLGLPARQTAPPNDFRKPAMNLYSPCPAEFTRPKQKAKPLVLLDCNFIDSV